MGRDYIYSYLSSKRKHSDTLLLFCFSLCVLNFDPADFQEAFEDVALFFCDPYGGSVIAVLWKPKAFAATPIKV